MSVAPWLRSIINDTRRLRRSWEESGTSDTTRRLTHVLLVGLACACISACGGEGPAAEEESSYSDPAVLLRSEDSFSTLLSDDGTVMPSAPDTVPGDVAARTRSGNYASSRQADQLERAMGDGAIRVNVECCGLEAIAQAVDLAHRIQAASDLPNDAPMLVRSPDLRLGAAAADRLSEAGHRNVWLVTR
jgi:hypothetical protein